MSRGADDRGRVKEAAYDWAVCGCRSQEDLKRLKRSIRHVINRRERWQASEFYGGRCKLAGNKKGTRPWWGFRVCLCPGQHHISPPKNFGKSIDKRGNPTVEVRWNTACPVACWEFYTSMMDPRDFRCYPKFCKSCVQIIWINCQSFFCIYWCRSAWKFRYSNLKSRFNSSIS